MKIKRILVSQPEPTNKKSPYFELAEDYGIQIDFRSFIHVEPIPGREFRKSKINIMDHSAVILTSRTAVDHFFRICEELRVNVPESMKYFCISESTAYYLQKYIIYRKRKIFYADGRFSDLLNILSKHKSESYFVPLSDCHKEEIPRALKRNKLKFSKGILYRTVSSDLSDLKDIDYDILVFYSPSGISSLFKNFPDFEQNNKIIASFGNATTRTAKDYGLSVDIQAPKPKMPSMTMALEQFLKQQEDNNLASTTASNSKNNDKK